MDGICRSQNCIIDVRIKRAVDFFMTLGRAYHCHAVRREKRSSSLMREFGYVIKRGSDESNMLAALSRVE
jgi:hypothetical protein